MFPIIFSAQSDMSPMVSPTINVHSDIIVLNISAQ